MYRDLLSQTPLAKISDKCADGVFTAAYIYMKFLGWEFRNDEDGDNTPWRLVTIKKSLGSMIGRAISDMTDGNGVWLGGEKHMRAAFPSRKPDRMAEKLTAVFLKAAKSRLTPDQLPELRLLVQGMQGDDRDPSIAEVADRIAARGSVGRRRRAAALAALDAAAGGGPG